MARAGNMYHRVKFYAKQTSRGLYGDSVDSWPIATINTRGEVRYVSGNKELSNEEKFYSKSVELTVRYRATILETMKVQIDGTNDLYAISYMEILGRKESLRLTLEKQNDGLAATPTLPPTSFTATKFNASRIDLAWVNNAANDGVVIQRSIDGNNWIEIKRIDKNIIPVIAYSNTGLTTATRYFYRICAFSYSNYSEFTTIAFATTD